MSSFKRLKNKRSSLVPLCCALLIFQLLSCAQVPKRASSEIIQDIRSNISYKIDYTISKQDLLKKIESAKNILKKKSFTGQERVELESLIYLYLGARSLSSMQVVIPAHSAVRAPLYSFCLNSELSPPSEFEPYFWRSSKPDLPIEYRTILSHASKAPAKKQSIYQEIIWNLKNNVRYEDYPLEVRNLLNELDPQAKYKLPSKIKDTAKNVVGNILNKNDVNTRLFSDGWSLIEGKYYRYNDIASTFDDRKINLNATSSALFPFQNNPKLFTENRSEDFDHQTSSFYNSGEAWGKIDLAEHSLESTRKEVQKIGVYAESKYYTDLAQILEKGLKDSIIRSSVYWYGSRLKSEELNLIQKHPIEALSVYIQAEKAHLSVLKYYAKDGEDDESDAIRHFVWAGLVAQNLDESLAQKFLNAHESVGLKLENEHLNQSSQMDIHNDQQGIDAARKLNEKDDLSWRRLEEEALKSLKEGRLRVLKPGQQTRYPGSG